MKVKNILFSQPRPAEIEKSPYYNLIKKFNVNCDFEQFIKIEGISAREFRLEKIYFQEYGAVILTSRNAIDHLFRMAKELRYEMPDSMRYFCNSESTAFYLQRYIQYRKRKVFHGKQTIDDLMELILKHKDEKFLIPCSDVHKNELSDKLDQYKISYRKAVVYKTVSKDITHLNLSQYEMIVLFTPSGVKSLFENFPDFKQGDTLFGAFGASTITALKEANIRIDVQAPTPKTPSMTMAIEEYLQTLK
ncbi:MAG: uroporphyrinogen-III synthase [Bacteroidales bacterium]|jgi:uroporphyrinogen-III synthase|nr:uroporphyrinogen-III synthase [Bacteroidales bacterium]